MFDPCARDFNCANALFLAQASQAAYFVDKSAIQSSLHLNAPPELFECKTKGACGFVGSSDGFTLLAFKGTSNIQGWLTDDCIIQVRDPAYPGLVHFGFSRALDVVWDQIVTLLKKRSAGDRLWLTGHSLGGALASLAASRLQAGGTPVQAVYTFGSPRTANVDYYNAYQPATFRIVHNADVVPHVPLEILLLKFTHFIYKHVGTLKYLDSNGKICDAINWRQKRQAILDALKLHGGIWPEAISDHFIGNYISAIRGNLEETEKWATEAQRARRKHKANFS